MMEFIEEAIKQVPGLGVMAFIVWTFLRHMAERDKAIRDMHREHLEARGETQYIIKENTNALHEQSGKLDEVCRVLKSGSNNKL